MTKTTPKRCTGALINKKRVRMYLLDIAKQARYHKFTAVKASTLSRIEGEIRSFCESYISKLPSKGKRI